MANIPAYFTRVQKRAKELWDLLDERPDLAGPWHQLFKQVQSPRHVISELLQNADDAGATEASADIQNGEFVFTHNGEDFKEEHFESLCKFGYSNKRSLHTIGFRGIGFKSTFSLGDQVRLFTPTLSTAFNRERFTEPVWIHKPNSFSHTAIQVTIKDEHRQAELEKNLSEWFQSSASLLFFHNLRSLRICGQEVRWQSLGVGPVPESEWMALASKPEEQYLLIRSAPEAFPPDALEEIRQERMVLSDDEAAFPPCRVEIVLGMEGRLFVVLPTGVSTALPFACNAPFIQDPARFKIKAPGTSPTNRWLLARAGALAAEAMLTWVNNTDFSGEKRAQAYALLPDVDRKDNSLDGICAAFVEQAVEKTIKTTKFVMTEPNGLAAWGECHAFPAQMLDVWSGEQLTEFFVNKTTLILSRFIPAHSSEKLVGWGIVENVTASHIIDILRTKNLPRPETWRKLMGLWEYLSREIGSSWYYRKFTDVNIVPVQGKSILYSAGEVVRLGEKRLLNSTEDWGFLSKWLLVLNQNWLRFLAEQKRKAEERSDGALGQEVTAAYNLLEKLELVQASDVSHVINRVADEFFQQPECAIEDCVSLAQLAASLGASVSDKFQFVSRDGYRRSVSECIVTDVYGDLDIFAGEDWCKEHVLHTDYGVMLSCSEGEWRQWINSGRSGLVTFVPLTQKKECRWGRSGLEKELIARGYESNIYYPYVTSEFVFDDWDFDANHWELWTELAKEDSDFWGMLLARILKQQTSFWSKCTTARVLQVATTGTKRTIADFFLPAWIVKFRNLPCLQDTRGAYRQPAELLRRTPETEPLLDVEPFIRAEFDTEGVRPLLSLLGVRDTPTGPKRLLDRLRALSQSNTPPVYEVEKWYHRLDKLIDRCSADEHKMVKEAFANEKLILTDNNCWVSAQEVFLAVDVENFPDLPVIHPSVRQLSLWGNVGVSNRPTIELGINWLRTIDSGKSLNPDESRRVRSLLQRYPQRVWNECGHWINLDGEWVLTANLTHSLTMQTLIPWKHLFGHVKQRTADLQMLSADVCEQHPFSSLCTLAEAIEERLDDTRIDAGIVKKIPWLNILGSVLCRIILDDKEEMERIRELGSRLERTSLRPASGLKTMPYLENTPVGTPRDVNTLWKNHTFYINETSTAKMAKEIAQELSKSFNKQEIVDAIKFCYEREEKFIVEYMEENFNLRTKEEQLAIHATYHANNTDANSVECIQFENVESAEPQTPPVIVGYAAGTVATDDTNSDKLILGLENYNKDTIDIEQTPVQRRQNHATLKPRLFDVFAASRGYIKDSSSGNFIRKDGFQLEYASGLGFPWQECSPSGEILQSYWVKDICIEREPLKIAADVWELCVQDPQKYSLILAELDGTPVRYSGERICRLRDNNMIQLFPAEYRLVYSGTE